MKEKNSKTKRRVVIIGIVLLIIAILLLVKSCTNNNNNKDMPNEDPNNKTEDVTEDIELKKDEFSYFVTFVNIDGKTLQKSVYKEGEIPSYSGKTPTYEDITYTYTFIGWHKEFSSVDMDQKYVACFSKAKKTNSGSSTSKKNHTIASPIADTIMYDGNSHQLVTAGTVSTGNLKYALGNKTEAQEEYSTTIPSAKDAGTYYVWYIVTDGEEGFGSLAQYVEVTIEKRNIVLTSTSKNKTYDGKKLTDYNVTVSGNGFASGESATYKFTGSQTKVGSSLNSFSYNLSSSAKEENYNITKVEGILQVNKITTKIIIKSADDTKSYDGIALTNDSYTYTNGILMDGDTLFVVVEGTITNVGSVSNKIKSYTIKNLKGEDVTSCYTFGDFVEGKLVINKADQTISTPELDSKTMESITLKALDAGVGETRYAINTVNSAPTDSSAWQDGVIFNNLSKKTTYYLFAKYLGNDNYNAIVSSGVEIKTKGIEYAITTAVTNVTAGSNPVLIEEDTTNCTLSFTANEGYAIFESGISVEGATYSWNNGTLTLSNPTKAVSVTIVGVNLGYFLNESNTRVGSYFTLEQAKTNASGVKQLFLNTTGATKIVLPSGVTEIATQAFVSLNTLTSINLSETVKKIGYEAFYCCNNLKDINLENVETIEARSFEQCGLLTEITLKNIKTISYLQVSNIEGNAIKTVNYLGTKSEWENVDFKDDNSSIWTIEKIVCTDGNIYRIKDYSGVKIQGKCQVEENGSITLVIKIVTQYYEFNNVSKFIEKGNATIDSYSIDGNTLTLTLKNVTGFLILHVADPE